MTKLHVVKTPDQSTMAPDQRAMIKQLEAPMPPAPDVMVAMDQLSRIQKMCLMHIDTIRIMGTTNQAWINNAEASLEIGFAQAFLALANEGN